MMQALFFCSDVWHLAPAIAVARAYNPANIVAGSTSLTIRWTLTVMLYSTSDTIGPSLSVRRV